MRTALRCAVAHPTPTPHPPGYTKSHYTSLNALATAYAGKPLAILATPCNQFGGQEPSSAETLLAVLKAATGIVPAFPLTQPVSVNGGLLPAVEPAWALVRSACASPAASFDWSQPSWAPVTPRDVSWNFETVLFDRKGVPYRRYAPAVDPSLLTADIDALLA